MKKFLIIFGIVILLLAGAVWTYIFLFGVPQGASEIFGRFTEAPDRPGYSTNDEGTIDIGNEDTEDSTVARERLYQLTTRPVAGAVFVTNGIRYVEQGTGHIYEIALSGGSERMISGTTRPRTIRAVFSPNADHVALTSESGTSLETVLGTIVQNGADGGNLDITALPDGAKEVSFNSDGTALNFFVPDATGGSGYSYTLKTKETEEIFTIPLSDIRILWGRPTYIYTTPSAHAVGYLYRIGETGLEYVTQGSKGLMAFAYASGTIVTSIQGMEATTYDPEHGPIPTVLMIPEKCSRSLPSSQSIVCAVPRNASDIEFFPDDWYKGVARFTDAIVSIDGANGVYTGHSDLESESGRPIDVLSIGVNAQGDMIYFTNKYDGALWMLDLRRETGGREQVYE